MFFLLFQEQNKSYDDTLLKIQVRITITVISLELFDFFVETHHV